jgi:hypothetical protein
VSDVGLLFVVMTFGGYLLAVVMMPRWCFMTINRSSIWRLRDAIDTARRDGQLPAHHPAVLQVRGEVAGFLDILPFLTRRGLRLLLKNPAFRQADVDDPWEGICAGLSTDQRELLERFREDLVDLVARSVVLSSWSAIARLLVAALSRRFKNRDKGRSPQLVPLPFGFEVEIAGSSKVATEIKTAERLVDGPPGQLAGRGLAGVGI